jgi:hypothetical protein
LSAGLFALGGPSAAFVGYHQANDPALPPAVREAAKSVYEMVMAIPAVSGKAYPMADQWVDTTNPVQVRRFQDAVAALGPTESQFQSWVLAELRFCQINAQKRCHIFVESGQASTFVFREDRTPATAYHVLDSTISAFYNDATSSDPTEKRQFVSQQNLFFDLVNFAGVRQSAFGRPTARLNFFTSIDQVLSTGTDLTGTPTPLGQLTDYIEITMPQREGAALPIAKSPPKVGETLYLIGYPTKTTDYQALGGQDADGSGESVAEEQVMDPNEFRDKVGWSYSEIMFKVYSATDIFLRGYCDKGLSGGPVVNQNGEVVGVMSAGYIIGSPGEPTACSAFKIFDRSELVKLWDVWDKAIRVINR